jgi:hypothetical protein
MRPTQPNRVALPVIPRPGAEVVYKKISSLPPGGIICTVTYLESANALDFPVKKRRFLSKFEAILGRFRGIFQEKLERLRGNKALR